MKRVWKWILGIVLVLILCAAVAGMVFAFNHRFAASLGPLAQGHKPGNYAWRMPMHPGFEGPNTPHRQRAFGPGMYPHLGMWGGHGLMPFGGGFGLLAGLIRLFVPLAIFGLVAFLAYRLGKQAGARTAAPPAVAPPPPAPEVPEKGGEESPQ